MVLFFEQISEWYTSNVPAWRLVWVSFTDTISDTAWEKKRVG